MKKLIIFLLLLSVSAVSYSQSISKTTSQVKSDYLQKSKKQKIAAWALLLGGFGLEVTAFATAYETGSGATLLRAGFLAHLVSIPFFIMAHGNKKKAMNLSFKNETAPQIQKSSFVYSAVPSLTLKISI
jgi:hypothetical protein